MLIMIFSLITEKNSKDVFVTLIHHLKWFDVKTFIDFSFFSPPPDEKLEDLTARKRKIVSVIVVYARYYFLFMCTARCI